MNFLAHTYLSGDDENLIIGNFIADHVKGSQIDQFSPAIIKGIKMHRAIDHFTDTHEIVHRTKALLRVTIGKYSPVVADVYYDHFLASRFQEYSSVPLPQYADSIYQLLYKNLDILPDKTRRMLPHMEEQNWLLAYQSIDGMNQILTAMSRRAKFESNMQLAARELEDNYHHYEKDFNIFFPELMAYCKKFIIEY